MKHCTYCGRKVTPDSWYFGKYWRFNKPSCQWSFEDENIFTKLYLMWKNRGEYKP